MVRVRISAKKQGLEKFEFGKRYGIAYIGCSLFEEFRFTRKNKIEMCEYDDNDNKISSHWISRKELKKIINSGYVHWLGKHKDD
jgi:hypothetical protein